MKSNIMAQLKMQTYYLNRNLCLEIRREAKRQRISMSKLAEMGLEQYLKSLKKKTPYNKNMEVTNG
jgi:hypothetical protein